MIQGFQPGSVIWIKSEDPLSVIAALDERTRRCLIENYYCIVTTPEVQIEELNAQDLKAFGLRKIPKPVTDPPLPSA